MTVRDLIHKLLDMPLHYEVRIELPGLVTEILPITDVYKGRHSVVLDLQDYNELTSDPAPEWTGRE